MNVKVQGHCERCEAPLFLNHTMDWYGNSVLTLNCWNGHYSWIKIEDLEELEILPSETGRQTPAYAKTEKKPVTYIGFFSLK